MKETNSLKQILVEKETDKMKNQLKKVIVVAMKSLWFPPIFEDGYGKNEQYDEGDYFQKADGALLRGRLVFYSGEFCDQTVNGNVDFSMEVFLTGEGELLKFYTIRESRYCQDCQETHTRLHRMVAKDQSLMEDELDAILNNITVDLRNAS
ncbi:hypothetical protein B5V88_10465 [Heyndrickxia sporothermodurans]|uniref:Uncharacterized protein n=1 Tax=Heyndrickxia sporothermodurans TaxID=46224 RepID=A0AB37HPH4_9BACI|nr:hypothetical protein [Heyndrickxia sporothermodurans]MBL5768653.1 hypothetical protein [Heyndrickxia sporothermodurans]MBL5772289.1 hypothetical protein [Heyndrickxia sporothermodurans]MBL5775840.1 hypothetical protein [Heyndrickxia sporothermodurans]MBL5779368.1 hypothetical protein [Heyndrickxia sporothermodurans]MBL5782442.1 hypothetical protein [Heyndrickxia sporothermodurans]